MEFFPQFDIILVKADVLKGIIMRIMAIDYGDVRTGIAVSDRGGTLVGRAWTVKQRDPHRLAELICAQARDREVGVIVLGCPVNMDGSSGPRAEKSQAFAQILRDCGAPEVKMWDERRTSVSADNILKDVGKHGKRKKELLDAVAASLILEAYLASLKRDSF